MTNSSTNNCYNKGTTKINSHMAQVDLTKNIWLFFNGPILHKWQETDLLIEPKFIRDSSQTYRPIITLNVCKMINIKVYTNLKSIKISHFYQSRLYPRDVLSDSGLFRLYVSLSDLSLR